MIGSVLHYLDENNHAKFFRIDPYTGPKENGKVNPAIAIQHAALPTIREENFCATSDLFTSIVPTHANQGYMRKIIATGGENKCEFRIICNGHFTNNCSYFNICQSILQLSYKNNSLLLRDNDLSGVLFFAFQEELQPNGEYSVERVFVSKSGTSAQFANNPNERNVLFGGQQIPVQFCPVDPVRVFGNLNLSNKSAILAMFFRRTVLSNAKATLRRVAQLTTNPRRFMTLLMTIRNELEDNVNCYDVWKKHNTYGQVGDTNLQMQQLALTEFHFLMNVFLVKEKLNGAPQIPAEVNVDLQGFACLLCTGAYNELQNLIEPHLFEKIRSNFTNLMELFASINFVKYFSIIGQCGEDNFLKYIKENQLPVENRRYTGFSLFRLNKTRSTAHKYISHKIRKSIVPPCYACCGHFYDLCGQAVARSKNYTVVCARSNFDEANFNC